MNKTLTQSLLCVFTAGLLSACSAAPGATQDEVDAPREPLGKADKDGASCVSAEENLCGGPSRGLCWCDESCLDFGDCCHDAEAACLNEGDDGPATLINEGLKFPESVALDEQTGLYYVTNLGHNILETDFTNPPRNGDGFVSVHDTDGALINDALVSGLHGPKGIAVGGDIIYIADLNEVVAADSGTGEIVARYDAGQIAGLNDVAVGEDGIVWVTNTSENAVHRIDPKTQEMSQYIQDPVFDLPNGIAVDRTHLYLAATGQFAAPDGSMGSFGHIYRVPLDAEPGTTPAVERIGDLAAKFDGVVVQCDGSLAVNDFLSGTVYRVDPQTGESSTLLEPFLSTDFGLSGLADINATGCGLTLPSMFSHEVFILEGID